MSKPTLSIDEILRVVRDAGAWDDNMGGEDWSHSDRSIASAKQQLTQLIADIVTEPNGNMMPPTIDESMRQRAKERGIDL